VVYTFKPLALTNIEKHADNSIIQDCRRFLNEFTVGGRLFQPGRLDRILTLAAPRRID
jgi:hypothetical protein